ncbi:MAG TPA: ATP-binding protein [Solirubrobacteraceae bacterium]|nr:ATP-binding protein [Solirubrobacteraceae bacterium]
MSTVPVEAALNGPPEEIGPELAAVAEDQWFERKSARIAARDLADWLIGFANADGGIVVVGIRSGKVEGTDGLPEKRNEQMQASIDFCEPAVRVRQRILGCINERGDADHLLAIEVEPSDLVHANKRDEVFLRVGDENRRLTFHQRQELLYDKGQASYEARPLPAATIEDLDMALVDQYVKAVQATEPTRLLQARGLADNGTLTVAGCLLFAEHPQRLLPETFVRVLRYRGRERGTGARQQLLEDVRIDGPIPLQLFQARETIQSLQPVRRALVGATGRFGEVPLVPEDAWLEGLVNAVVHRSYSIAGDHIRIEIFDDRIEIWSPGRFPGLVDLSEPLDATRFARNPRIARVCSDLSFGQELGEGIRRMFEEMRRAGLDDPIYRQGSGGVHLTLLTDPIDQELDARLSERARRIMSALREGKRLSTGEVAELLDISRPVAQRELAALREAGATEWVGKSPRDPRAFWRLR